MAFVGLFIGSLFLGSLLAGVVLLTLGLRGRPVFTAPRCARCRYDLRTKNFLAPDIGRCPECGADLNHLRAVNFARLERWPRMIVSGVILLVLPLLLLLALVFYSYSSRTLLGPRASANLPTAALLANLPQTLDQPWDWQELEKRLQARTLSTEDVDTALHALITDWDARRAQDKPQEPLHWSNSFIALALQRGAVSAKTRDQLCQAYYRQEPVVRMRTRQRQDQPLEVCLEFHAPWNFLGYRGCWALQSVKADGKIPLTPRNPWDSHAPNADHPDRFSGADLSSVAQLKLDPLPPGEHELTFTLEEGVVTDTATFIGLDGKPGPAEKWPAPLARWSVEVNKKIRVVGNNEPVVTLVTAEAENPLAGAPLDITRILTRPASQGVDILIEWKEFKTAPALPLSYAVVITAGARKIAYGSFLVVPSPNGMTDHRTHYCTVPDLPADIKTVDVSLIPDVKPAEKIPGIERIWGLPLEFKNVPLDRVDLQSTTRKSPSGS